MKSVPLLGRRQLMALAGTLGSLAWFFDRRGRITTMENLRFVFGETLDLEDTARKAYQNMARTFLELFWIPRFDKELVQRIIERTTDPPGIPPLEAGKPSILVSPHFGNFELLTHAHECDGEPLMIPAQDFKNPLLTPMFSALREKTGHTLISSKGGLLRLMRHLRRGGETAFLSDLTFPPDKAATIVDCFGFPTSATAAHIELARRTGAVLVPHISVPLPEGRYREVRGEPIDVAHRSNTDAAQACWDFYEPHMRATPHAWLWMYKHWRYLPRGVAPESFPAYANRSKKFDALLDRERPAPPDTGG